MRGALLVACLTAVLAGAGVVVARDGPAAPSRGCAPQEARVLQARDRVRVYVFQGQVLGCVVGHKPRVLIHGKPNLDPMPIAVRGSLLAYGGVAYAQQGFYSMSVELDDLAAPGVEELTGWLSGDEEHFRVARLVIGPGPEPSVAWTACPVRREPDLHRPPVCPPGSFTHLWLIRGDDETVKRVLVAEGTALDAHSLRARGERFRWTQGTRRRSDRFSRSFAPKRMNCETAGVTVLRTRQVRIFRAPAGSVDASTARPPWGCLRPKGEPFQFDPEAEGYRLATAGRRVAFVRDLFSDTGDTGETQVVVVDLRTAKEQVAFIAGTDVRPVTGVAIAPDGAGAVTIAGSAVQVFGAAGGPAIVLRGTEGARNLRRAGRHSVRFRIGDTVHTVPLPA